MAKERDISGKSADAISSAQRGFTLVELAIVMIILGVISSGALLSASQYVKAERVASTREKIALVENALSSYAQEHYRLPCPADPQAGTGVEVDGGNCFKNASNASLYWETEGVVPWKELGIPQSLVVDSWQHYITYKPAPQLTVDNLSVEEQNGTNTAASMQANGTNEALIADVHNACRTAMWYSPDGNHLHRAKALFCCNSAPTDNYINNGAYGVGGALSADWRKNGIVDTTTAKNLGAAGNSMADGTPVAMTSNWMDKNDHTDTDLHGAFVGFNGSKPEPPLLRATGLAVTLISHGGSGDLSFLPGQIKTALFGGGTVDPVGGGINAPGTAAVKAANVWPPNIFAGVFGHPKVNDGSYNPLRASANSSDDVVSYLRSDDLFGRVGQASCERPPAAVFQPELPCKPQDMTMSPTTFNPDPKIGLQITIPTISMQLKMNQDVPYILQSTMSRMTDDAGYHNSIGVYTIGPDGAIQGVRLMLTESTYPDNTKALFPDIKAMALGGIASAQMPLATQNSSVGTFVLPDGYDINSTYFQPKLQTTDPQGKTIYVDNPHYVDMTSLKMVYNFGQPDERPANITDTDVSKISLVAKDPATEKNGDPSTITYVALHGSNQDYGTYNAGAGGNGIFHMYSNLNYNQVDHGWRPSDISAASKVTYAGPDPSNPKQMITGFEDLSTIACYYAKGASPGDPDVCVNPKPPKPADPKNPQPGEAVLDQFGGYEAYIGDNDYDDVAASMKMSACPQQQ